MFYRFFDIVFVIQNKGNHHFPSSCDSAVTVIPLLVIKGMLSLSNFSFATIFKNLGNIVPY